MGKKILWTVIIIVVIVVLYLLLSGSPKTSAPTTGANLPAVTADNSTPDAIVNSLTTFDSAAAPTPVENDPTLTAPDQASMTSLSQSFDSSQIPNQ